MKITYAVPRYLPHLGGIENHVAALATRAARHGHQVAVLTQQEGEGATSSETIDGISVIRFRSGLRLRGQGISPGLWRAARRYAETSDVLHLHNVHGASTLGALVAVHGARVVVTPHYLGVGEGLTDRLLHHAYDPALRRGLRHASAIICVSRAEADEFVRDLRADPERVHVIPNGVDLQPSHSARPGRGECLVLVAGRLERYKQAAAVIEAMPFLPTGYSLAIAGDGPEASALRATASKAGVANRVRFLGKLTPSEMTDWYQRSTVVVSMSRRECFGMTLAEGLAAGCSVVASDIPAHREIFEKAGWHEELLVSVDLDARGLATTLMRAANSYTSPRGTIATWDDVAASTFRLYQAVQGSHGGPS